MINGVTLYSNKEEVITMKRLYDYTIILRPEDNGTFVAYVPAIAGCHAWGKTPEEAQSELINVFEMIVEEYEAEGRMLPEDVDVKAVHACQS
jgi:predicted RNase H-like HicB family nuclease